MNQLFAIAMGGAAGAVLRFLMSTAIYQWLGKGFPYGTLAVNVSGSFMLGLLTEALILNRIAFAQDYRSAILVGFIGAYTTFSTFSLETVSLLAQGALIKALLNVAISVAGCLLAIWLGLLCGKASSLGVVVWADGVLPYTLMIVNGLGAFLLVAVMTILLTKAPIEVPQQLVLVVILAGSYLMLTGLYVLLYALEHDHLAQSSQTALLIGLLGNTLGCLLMMVLGLLTGKQLLKIF